MSAPYVREHRPLALVLNRVAVVAMGVLVGCASSPEMEGVEEVPVPLNCSVESLDALSPSDIVFAFDNSLSSQHPSGFDIDGDGTVGEIRSSVFTDRGDSWLGVEVEAARKLIRNTAALDIRFSIVTFADSLFVSQRGSLSLAVGSRDAKERAGLTRSRASLESALDQIMTLGSDGSPNFYAGARRANQVLIEAKNPKRRRIVMYFSDTPGPLFLELGKPLRGGIGVDVARATGEAERNDITFNTFGLTQKSGAWRGYTLGLIAQMTGGTYHAATDPTRLYCHLVDSLVAMGKLDDEEGSSQTTGDSALSRP
ncbi:MAG: hypothetical protein QMC73_03310 [Myxococcota bacterium]|jgi:hypothetical protein